MGRTAPDHLGVLGHYDVVIWYRGNDFHVREPGWGRRERLPAGGRRDPGGPPVPERRRQAAVHRPVGRGHRERRRRRTSSTTPWPTSSAWARHPTVGGRGAVPELGQTRTTSSSTTSGRTSTSPTPAWTRTGTRSRSSAWTGRSPAPRRPGGRSGAGPAPTTRSTTPRSSPPAGSWIRRPTRSSSSWISAKWDRPGGPFAPHTGEFYVYSQIADITYKRLARTIDVPAGGATMSFWTSYDTEAAWDHLFVEAHTVGQDNWTTLPDLNGHTTQATGESCKAGELGRLADPAPAARPLPDPDGSLGVHPHRDHRRLARRVGELRRLAAVAGRPERLRGPAGRGLHLLRERLVVPGPGRLRRRHRGLDRPGDHLVRGRAGRMEHSRRPAGELAQRRTTSTGPRRPGSPKGPLPPPRTPSTSASASRASPMRPTGTR